VKILVVGARGQLARDLAECAPLHPDLAVLALGRPRLDLLDEASIAGAIDAVAPDVVVNAAAYTAVDKAEREVDAAFAVNRDGAARSLARPTPMAARSFTSPPTTSSTASSRRPTSRPIYPILRASMADPSSRARPRSWPPIRAT
jgi:hypothetical protein